MPATIASHHHHHFFTVPGTHISAKAVLGAGLLAGAVYFVLEMLMARFVLGISPWVPTRMIAAVTQGSVVLPPPYGFDLSITIAAVIQHAVLSLVYAFIFAFFAKGRSIMAATVLGAGYGLLLYAINFYGFTEVFPWFAAERNWGTVLMHLIFGAVLGGTYAWLAPHEAHPAS